MQKFSIFLMLVYMIFIMLWNGSASVYACHITNEVSEASTGHKWHKRAKRESKGPVFSQTFDQTTYATNTTTTSSTSCDVGIAEIFLEEESDQIKEDASKGVGQHLDALARILGCPTKSYPEFRKKVKHQHSTLFTTSDVHLVKEKLVRIIETTLSLNKTCAIPYL